MIEAETKKGHRGRPVEERVEKLFKPVKLSSVNELDVVTSKKEADGCIIVKGFNDIGLGVLVLDETGNITDQDFRNWPSTTLKKTYIAYAVTKYNRQVEDFMDQVGIGKELEKKYH